MVDRNITINHYQPVVFVCKKVQNSPTLLVGAILSPGCANRIMAITFDSP